MQNLLKYLLATAGVVAVVNITTFAQTTAFTYQGQLEDTNGPVNGNYDLRFALYDAGTNGTQVGAPLTNAPVAVTNGLLTVILDFGAGIFTGAPRWLEIGVRTNGSVTGYTTMGQRQQLTPTPYAIYSANAASAVSVAAGSVTGTGIAPGTITGTNIAAGQIVKSLNGLNDNVTLLAGANITLTPSGNNIQISSAGTGGGGGLTWQIAGTNQQAQSNVGYIVTNRSALTTILLPSAPNPGDIIQVAGAGAGGWAIAQNSGQTILGTTSNALQTTTPSGVSWTATGPSTNWSSVASSTDGTKLVAVGNGGEIYTSTDSGVNWTSRQTITNLPVISSNWVSVASSSDGSTLAGGCHTDCLSSLLMGRSTEQLTMEVTALAMCLL